MNEKSIWELKIKRNLKGKKLRQNTDILLLNGLKNAILVLGNSLSITGIFIPGGTIASKGILVSIAAIQISIDIILSKI